MLLDTHCHLDQYENPLAVAKDCERKKIFVIAVTNLPGMFEEANYFLRDFKYVKPALGFHPLLANEYRHELKKVKELIDYTKYIGEIGLDFSQEGKYFQAAQIESFKFILGCLKGKRKFLTLHSRGAESLILDIMEEFQVEGAVLHWYSGSLKILERAISLNYFFSINPAMINSPNGKKIIDRIPKDRILTETDGPFVKVKGKPAMPENVELIHNYLSNLWKQDTKKVIEQIKYNFESIKI